MDDPLIQELPRRGDAPSDADDWPHPQARSSDLPVDSECVQFESFLDSDVEEMDMDAAGIPAVTSGQPASLHVAMPVGSDSSTSSTDADSDIYTVLSDPVGLIISLSRFLRRLILPRPLQKVGCFVRRL